MNEAPLLRTFSTSPRLFALEQKYGAWATHFETCTTCNKTEWYDPITEFLCAKGRLLLADWKLAAVTSTPEMFDEIYGRSAA